MKRTFSILCLIVALFLAGCGPSAPPEPVTETLYSESALDGDVQKYHETTVRYTAHAGRTWINVGHESVEGPGETMVHVSLRCFVSFDLSAIPDGAAIQTATLKIYKLGGNGDEFAYTVLGNLLLDHVAYTSFGTDLYELEALETPAIPFAASHPSVWSWQELDVTSLVQGDLDHGRAHAQFRLRFAKEVPDDPDDYACYYENWAPGEEAVVEKPELVVTYLP